MARYEPRRYNRTLLEPEGEHEPRRLERRRDRVKRLTSSCRRPPVIRLLLLAVALATTAMLGRTTARYLENWSNESLVTAGDFCFVSKELDGDPGQAIINQDSNTAEYTFTLRNYVVMTQPAQSDIQYSCSVTVGNLAVEGVTWHSRDRADGQAGILAGKRAEEREITCQIPMEAFRGGDEVKVTVASSKPYVKEMTATVVLPGTNGGVEMTVTDLGQDFGAVSVTLYNTGGQACTGVLDWPGRDKLYELKQIADPTARAEAAAQAADALLLAPDPTWEGAVKSDGRVTIPGGGVVSVVLVKRDAQQTFNKDSGFRFTPDTPTTPTEGSN